MIRGLVSNLLVFIAYPKNVKHLYISILLFVACHAYSQDSTRTFSHEFGVNIGSLLQQVRIFTISPGGLPYDLFYNNYYKNKFGIRAGLGILTVETNTQIEGQDTPRKVKESKNNYRLGLSAYALHARRVHLNFFVDGFLSNTELTTSNTSTVQVFPLPVTSRTDYSSDRVNGGGVQGGAGLRVDLSRHLSLYFETAIVYTSATHVIEDRIIQTAKDDQSTKSLTTEKKTRVDLPNTFYVLVKF